MSIYKKKDLQSEHIAYLAKKVEINLSSIYLENASDNQLAETCLNFLTKFK